MSITATQIQALVEAELARIDDQRVITHIRGLLVEPTVVLRAWNYGIPGQTYPCWAVLNHPQSNTGIAYCEFGFGPRAPWGLVSLPGASYMAIGMDSGWYPSLLEAYFESWASVELPIWRVFKQKGDSWPGTPLTEESDWNSTWEELHRREAADPKSLYLHSHSIQIRPIET